ncbi:MAG: 23S rRNA (uracil(1939)-C(5))-methyltransferase RlmD [Clostridia bacterium]|nr:23S rRNA (uracil(1939)-C(5))-methyltransferase RlmD [Clostridia bacterium]
MKQETNKTRKEAWWNEHNNRRNARKPAEPHDESPKPAECTEDQCPLYKKCGGCQMQNLSYERQLQWKQALEVKLLGRFGHVGEIIGMDDPYHYRNKVQAAFGMTRGGKIISGVYQSGTHRIVSVDDCMIEDRAADKIIVTIRSMLRSFKLLPYNEDTGAGFLRHVLVRRGFATNEIMVVLVTGKAAFPAKKDFVTALLAKHPEITTIVQNINDAKTSMVLGEREEVLYGPGKIEDILCGCRFRISARSFYQINPVQTEVLYGKAVEYAGLTGKETVIDAYCGIGTIGLIAAKHAKSVIGVEVNTDAVKDAKVNAKANGLENAQFFAGDAGEFMEDMARNGEHADVVFMDPPRAGSDRKFLSSVLTLAPDRIVYVSCNPETLARDLMFLSKNGYKVRKIQPVDMFPHTHHVETVVLLSRKNG